MSRLDDGPCERCSHPFAEHMMLAGPSAMAGGITVCPEWMCSCYSTWSTNGHLPSLQLQYELYREFLLGDVGNLPRPA